MLYALTVLASFMTENRRLDTMMTPAISKHVCLVHSGNTQVHSQKNDT